jgi:hypothetical protein
MAIATATEVNPPTQPKEVNMSGTYGPVTSLRLNSETGSVQEGSGDVVSARAEEGSSAFGYTEAELAGVQAFNNFDEFVSATLSPLYKGNDPMDPRPSEKYREEVARRLAKMEYQRANREAANAPKDTAGMISELDPSVPYNVAQLAVERGPFLTREERQSAYSNPLYKSSEDFRAVTAARDAITPF